MVRQLFGEKKNDWDTKENKTECWFLAEIAAVAVVVLTVVAAVVVVVAVVVVIM